MVDDMRGGCMMATCGDIDGKPCEWHLTRDCPADRPDWHPSRSNQVCPPVAALLECRRDRDLYDRMGSFSYRSALEWKERAEKAQARIAELERELFVSQCSLKSADTDRQFDQARIEELEHKLSVQNINQSDYDDAVDRYEKAEAERDRLLEDYKRISHNIRVAIDAQSGYDWKRFFTEVVEYMEARAALRDGDDDDGHGP